MDADKRECFAILFAGSAVVFTASVGCAVVENGGGSAAEIGSRCGHFPPHTFDEMALTLFMECKTTTLREKIFTIAL
jgi:hypothetical protein